MDEDKLVRMIAEPVLEALEAMQQKEGDLGLVAVPQIHVLVDGNDLDDRLARKLECYLQQRLEEMPVPTLLH